MAKKKGHHLDYLEFNKINNYIYLGNNMCCQTHFLQKLIKKGVVADISVEYERLDEPKGAKYFLWLPTRDHTALSQDHLKLGTDAMKSLIKNKKKMYVHCKNGHGRSPTLVVAYFITTGMTTEQAIRFVKSKRPVTHISLLPLKALKRFEKSVMKS